VPLLLPSVESYTVIRHYEARNAHMRARQVTNNIVTLGAVYGVGYRKEFEPPLAGAQLCTSRKSVSPMI
jgi:hypothetical protein